MGYYVDYTIKVPKENIDEVVLILNTLSDYYFQQDGYKIFSAGPYMGATKTSKGLIITHGFEPHIVFQKLSSHFPNIEINVLFNGELSNDLRSYTYKNGEQIKEVDLISNIYKNWESYL